MNSLQGSFLGSTLRAAGFPDEVELGERRLRHQMSSEPPRARTSPSIHATPRRYAESRDSLPLSRPLPSGTGRSVSPAPYLCG